MLMWNKETWYVSRDLPLIKYMLSIITALMRLGLCDIFKPYQKELSYLRSNSIREIFKHRSMLFKHQSMPSTLPPHHRIGLYSASRTTYLPPTTTAARRKWWAISTCCLCPSSGNIGSSLRTGFRSTLSTSAATTTLSRFSSSIFCQLCSPWKIGSSPPVF